MGNMPGNQNHTFKYKTADLLTILTENRAKHEVEYDEAMIEYHTALKTELGTTIEKLKNRLQVANEGKDISHRIESLQTVKPTQYLNTYDRFIKMFSMMVEETIDLDSETFSQLVLDEWEWRHSFDNSTRLYSK